MLKAEGVIVIHKDINGRVVSCSVMIPSEVFNDSQFPFDKDTKVEVNIVPWTKQLVVTKV